MKNWLITGTSSGIGRAITEKCLSKGDRVFATLRNEEKLRDLLEKYPKTLKVAHLELTDNDEIQSVINFAFQELGTIDIVVSNAGYGLFGAVEELSDDMIRHQLDVNLLGSIRLIKAIIPHLRKQAKGGHIIQVSSEGGQIVYPGFSLYHASKWGIEGFVESISKDLAPFNIKFTIAEPGPTSTNFAASLAMAEPLDAYQDTPVNDMRKFFEEGFGELDDSNDVANVIIESALDDNPPLRVAIGKVACTNLDKGLKERIATLQLKKSN